MIHLLIADDETLFRRLIAAHLAREPDFKIVGEAANGREAVELSQQRRPDVILMDLQMPVLNGVQAIERIAARQPWIRIILLTALEELASVGQVAGAFESLSKQCTPDELYAAIRRAAQTSSNEAAPGAGEGAIPEATLARISRRHDLSGRERRVLELVVNTGDTVAAIAHRLTVESGAAVSASAVRHALERVMTKLRIEPRTRAALVRFVMEIKTQAK